jgi:cyclopropane fatty-acyl-phospholipid synthase-like methyltransferase
VPTPAHVVDAVLDLAGVGSNDVVYDLGSGDGRIVIRAAQRHGARGVGVELDPRLVRRAR